MNIHDILPSTALTGSISHTALSGLPYKQSQAHSGTFDMIIVTESVVAAYTYTHYVAPHTHINLLTVIAHAQQPQSDIVHV